MQGEGQGGRPTGHDAAQQGGVWPAPVQSWPAPAPSRASQPPQHGSAAHPQAGASQPPPGDDDIQDVDDAELLEDDD